MNLIKIVSALVLSVASFASSATPINGGFSISGGATPLGSTDFSTATGVNFNSNPVAVNNCVGDIASILGGASCGGATATVNSIGVNSIPTGSGGALSYANPGWITLNMGGITFSIDAITAYEHSATFGSLALAGTGVMNSTAGTWTPTAGTFSFTVQGLGQTFSFSSSQVTAGTVPVPGSLALLCAGVFGAATSARRKKA